MRVFVRLYSVSFKFPVLLLFLILLSVGAAGQQNAPGQKHSPLAEILLCKGILTSEEIKQVDAAPTPEQSELVLARLLADKGVLTKAEFEQIAGKAPLNDPAPGSAPAAQSVQAIAAPKPPVLPAVPSQPAATQEGSAMETAKPQPPATIAAIAPIRALPLGGVARSAEAPAVKSNGVGLTPYGAIKATAVEDSSSPNGDDFPLPGFMCDSGPDNASEFHLKARSSRVGVNLAWNDPNPRWSVTGKLEMDFEGNFNRSDNRNISSIRSNNPSLRLAWARLDFTPDRNNVFSALFGQDWSPFGSSTLPNILETTSMGIGYGTLYERTPQMRIGYTHKSRAFDIMPEFAITLPAVGLVPAAANVSQQLGYGERQGADSNRPDVEGRIVGQWQLDHAPGVAPAQLIVSMERGERRAVLQAASVPSAYQKTFATGASGSSQTNGWDFEWQLPTRFATLVGKFYSGAGLRYFFVNQLYSYYNDTAGLTNLASVPSMDGSSTIVFGTDSAGRQVVAPERSIRTAGGFAQLGLPLSRIFKANPAGRDAGWTLYALYGNDQAKGSDLLRLGGSTRHSSSMAVGTLNYSLNRWVSFSFEHSLYTTHANTQQTLPLFRGVPAREWHDVREEFGPVFTF
jgi:hypothetical protein